jgi:hypothetical protein
MTIQRERSLHRLKVLIWIYLLLLIFEGAVRKWIPPLSTPFLLIRDPVALLIWFSGARLRLGDQRAWGCFYIFAWIVTTLGLLQIIGDSISPLIILYGWRSYVLHIPVIIVLAGVLDMEDLRKIGKWVLLISIPMTLLMCAQYLSPPESFLNRGASGVGGQISGALGHIRPAGTFSFISGPISFVPLVAAFCLWGMTDKRLFPKWLVYSAAIATVAVVPVSISRTIAIDVGAIIATTVIGVIVRSGVALKPERLPQIALSIMFILVALIGVAQIPLVQDATNTFTTRWTQAQQGTGNNSVIEERGLSLFTEAFAPVTQVSALGTGIGSGSAVAAALTGGSEFEYGENALAREVFELGSWLGPLFLLMRFGLAAFFVVAAFRALYRGMMLPWLLIVPTTVTLALGSLDQATVQGFFMVLIGISIAALRVTKVSVLS